jgi:hypothetical protein
MAAWSSSVTGRGDLSIGTDAALVGFYGLKAFINNNPAIYVIDNTPNLESHYRARFYFDPNSINMATNDAHFIFYGIESNGKVAVRLEFGWSGSNYRIRAGLRDNTTGYINTSWFTINDAMHVIEFDWQASTGPGANNGNLGLWIDGIQQANLAGINNDSVSIDSIRLGAVAGVDKGTRGTLFFDEFRSNRQTYIGP